MMNEDTPSETILDVIDEDSVAVAVQKMSSPSELPLQTEEEQPAPVKQKSSTLSGRIIKRLVSVPKLFSAVGRSSRDNSAKVHAQGFKFITAAQRTSGWSKVEKQFDQLTEKSDDGRLLCSQFGECIGMEKTNEFADALFRALAKRSNITGDSINKQELKHFWDQISNESFDTRLQTYLAIVDKDGDGKITEEELTQMISLSASTNKLKNIHKQAKDHAALIMENLDPDKDGYITIEKLETMLIDASTQSVTETDDVIPNEMITANEDPKKNGDQLSWYQRTKFFLMDNWQREWVMILWLAVVIGLFTYKFIQFRNKAVFQVMGYCVCVAKGSGETLKFNMAIVLLPVCRNTITWLRTKMKLGVAVPFDDNLNFHKVIAVGIAVGVGLHAIPHLTCDFPRLLNATPEEYKPMQKYFGEVQPDSYGWFMKGFAGWTGIVMVVLMAVAFTLATTWLRRFKPKADPKLLDRLVGFNAFWYSHHLFVIVYALLIVHGIKIYLTKTWYQKTTWMYLGVPVILYACERLIRAFRSSIKSVKIIQAAKFEGSKTKVLALRMSKPDGFKYKSGQYMFVKCTAVSPFEWHPFSITSAPGDDYLGVHIKGDGDWTNRLITKVPEVSSHQLATGKSGLLIADSSYPPKISIDGPYGAPAQDYSKYDVVMLVGLGIGGTPMVSIIKDIIHNNIKIKEKEDNTSNPNPNPKCSLENKKGFRTQKAYFYWVTPEQDCSQWFKEVMDDVAEMDKMHLIELNNYCSSVYKEDDARSALITMLQSLQYAKKGVDVVSGTRVRSHFARPDWRRVYNNIALHHPKMRVGVFYCGLPTLTKELRNLARQFSRTTSTNFEFHKENF